MTELRLFPLVGEEAEWAAWLRVESALATAESELGVIPLGAAESIREAARIERLDVRRIRRGLQQTGHPLVPLVWELSRVVGEPFGGWVHWGATTQNITQTGATLLLRDGYAALLADLADLLSVLADLSDRSAEMPTAARTHGQHAVPTTFGCKVAGWADEIIRHSERLREAEPRLFVSLISGAAGTFAGLGTLGPEIHRRVASLLGLRPMDVPARNIADHFAEYVCLLALLGSTVERGARELYTLMKTEYGEVEESIASGVVGSSTMPQKRNPQSSQAIIVGSAKLRALVPQALEAMQGDHEADAASHILMMDATAAAHLTTVDLLELFIEQITGLNLRPKRMRENLDLTSGLIMSEPVMLALGAKIGRQEAHEVTSKLAQAAAISDRPFLRLLIEDPCIRQHLDAPELLQLMDPATYTGKSAEIARATSERALVSAGELRAHSASLNLLNDELCDAA